MNTAYPIPSSRPVDHAATPMPGTVGGMVDADIVYLAAKHPSPRSTYRAGSDIAVRTGHYEPFHVAIRDIRQIVADVSLDREGFVLINEPTAVTDFFDEGQVQDTYYAEVERLVKSRTGATEVAVFDHTIRVQRADGDAIGQRAPVTLVHNDYTHRSGPQRVCDLFDEETAQRSGGGI